MEDNKISKISDLNDFYTDNKINWEEVVQSFELTNDFMRENMDKLDPILVLENQNIDLNTIRDCIEYFDVKDVQDILGIDDATTLVSLQKHKEAKQKEIEEKNKPKVEEPTPIVENSDTEDVSLDDIFNNDSVVEKEEIKEAQVIKTFPDSISFNNIHSSNGVGLHEKTRFVEPNEPKEIIKKVIQNTYPVTPIISKNVEIMAQDRVRAMGIDHLSVRGIFLCKSYIARFKELQAKYNFVSNNLDDLILYSIGAREITT